MLYDGKYLTDDECLSHFRMDQFELNQSVDQSGGDTKRNQVFAYMKRSIRIPQ